MGRQLTSVTQAQCDRAVRSARNAGLSISRIIIEGERIEVIIDNEDSGEKENKTVPLIRQPRT